jgi:hypothetical protein
LSELGIALKFATSRKRVTAGFLRFAGASPPASAPVFPVRASPACGRRGRRLGERHGDDAQAEQGDDGSDGDAGSSSIHGGLPLS